MSQKRLARAFGAGTLAMATVVSGLSFGPAAFAASDTTGASTTDTKVGETQLIFQDGYSFYSPASATQENGYSPLYFYKSYTSLADAKQNAPKVDVLDAGGGYVAFGYQTPPGYPVQSKCLSLSPIWTGTTNIAAAHFDTCGTDDAKFRLDGGTLKTASGRSIGSTSRYFRPSRPDVQGQEYRFLDYTKPALPLAEDLSAVLPVPNGGVTQTGTGFTTSLEVGETKDAFFGIRATGALTTLNGTSFDLQAPAGTKFVQGAAKSQTLRDGTWTDSASSSASVTVRDGGARATVTVSTTSSWSLNPDEQARWSVPLQGVSTGSGNVTFSADGTSNFGAFSTSGSSMVTVVTPSNGGVAPEGLGFPTTIAQNETAEVPFGLRAADAYGNLQGSVTLSAPDGTTFADQSRIGGQWREAGGEWSSTEDGLALGNIRISADGRTLTADFVGTGFGGQSKDAELRWLPKLHVNTSAATGTRNMGFTFAGSTSVGSFSASGTSAVTVAIGNGGVDPNGVGYQRSIVQGTQDAVPFGLRANEYYGALKGSVTLTAPSGTTFPDQASIPGQWRNADSTGWSEDVENLKLSNVRISGDRRTLTADFVGTDFGAQFPTAQLRWMPQLAADANATVGTRDMGFSFTGTTSNGAFTSRGNSAVTVVEAAPPVANGGIDKTTSATPLSLKIGETKDLFFGIKATNPVSAGTTARWTVNVPAGTKLSNAPVKAQKRNADGTWSDDRNSTATVTLNGDGSLATVSVTTTGAWALGTGGEYRWSLPVTGTAAGSAEASFFLQGKTGFGSYFAGSSARIDVQDVARLAANVDSVDGNARTARLSGTAEPGAQIRYGATVLATAGNDGRWSGTVSGLNTGAQTITLEQFVNGFGAGTTTVDITVVANGGLSATGIGFPLSLEPGETGTASIGFESQTPLNKIEDGTFTLNAPEGTTFPANPAVTAQYLAGADWTADPNMLLSVTVSADRKSATVSVVTRANWQMNSGQKSRISIPLQADANAASGTRNLSFTGEGTTSAGDFRLTGSSPVTIAQSVVAPTAQVDFSNDVTQKATVSGTGADGATITVKNGSAVLGTTTVRGGSWSLQIDPIGAGATTLTVEQTGVGSPQSVQTVADFGVAVAITGPSGSIVPGVTTITGTTQAGAKVIVSAGDKTVEATVTGTTWTAQLEIAPSATPVTVTAKQQSKGNLRTEATTQVSTDGAQQPTPVEITEPGDGTYTPGANTTVAGTATPYAKVVITNQWGATLTTVTADINGRWSFVRQYGPSAMYKLVATQTRVDGSKSASAEYTLAPVNAFKPLRLTTPEQTSSYLPGRAVLFTGTATPGATITATSSWGSTLFTTRASQTDGSWAATRSFGPTATYVITLTQTAPDGTTDRISPVLLTPPAHQDVVLTSPAQGATYTPGVTVRFTGTATPGATIAIKSKLSGTTIMTATADSSGQWAVSRQFGPTATYQLDIVATDLDGTTSSTELLNFAPAAN